MDDFSRSSKRARRRKTNLILNSLIAIVLLLIMIVAGNIFFGDDEKASTEKNNSAEVTTDEDTEEKQDEDNKEDQDGSTSEQNDESGDSNSDVTEETNEDETETETEPESEAVVSEGGEDSNVKRTIVNPAWKPIGTQQSGQHVAVYDDESIDWKEMLAAVSYASGVEQENMTVWFLGRNGDNKSVATITEKGNPQAYRVYIDWVDGQGWKPVKIEELIENDKINQ